MKIFAALPVISLLLVMPGGCTTGSMSIMEMALLQQYTCRENEGYQQRDRMCATNFYRTRTHKDTSTHNCTILHILCQACNFLFSLYTCWCSHSINERLNSPGSARELVTFMITMHSCNMWTLCPTPLERVVTLCQSTSPTSLLSSVMRGQRCAHEQ